MTAMTQSQTPLACNLHFVTGVSWTAGELAWSLPARKVLSFATISNQHHQYVALGLSRDGYAA